MPPEKLTVAATRLKCAESPKCSAITFSGSFGLPNYLYRSEAGALILGDDVRLAGTMTVKEAVAECDRMPACTGITYRDKATE